MSTDPVTSSPDRILHVPTPGDHYSAATGSAPMTIIYELSREHARRGGETSVIVGRGTRHDYPIGDVVEVPFGTLPDTRRKAVDAALGRLGLPRPFVAATYRAALDAVGPGFAGPLVVHNSPGAAAMFARRRGSARACLHVHNEAFRSYGRREARTLVSMLHRVVCVSAFVADRLEDLVGPSGDRLQVVHNGVDTDRFRPANASPDATPVILFVGRVLPEKGPDLLLKAAAMIESPSRPFTVRIVGSSGFSAADPLSSYEKHLRQLAAPLGDNVEFQPFVDRKRILDEYARAAIMCVPSNWDDPCPLTLPEGMASGLAVVASARGGMPEVGGDAVLWFRPPEIDELAGHLADLVDSPAARASWGARARRRAQELSWSRQYERYAEAVGG